MKDKLLTAWITALIGLLFALFLIAPTLALLPERASAQGEEWQGVLYPVKGGAIMFVPDFPPFPQPEPMDVTMGVHAELRALSTEPIWEPAQPDDVVFYCVVDEDGDGVYEFIPCDEVGE